MSNDLKVTDKRMFTADGELRDEFSHLSSETVATASASEATVDPPSEPAPVDVGREAEPSSPGPPLEIPGDSVGPAPGFIDLVAMLAEPIAIYLGDVELPDGRSAENLDAARLHIDLLDLLRHKTVGNLTAQESAALDDVLYQLKMRYVQKRG